MSFPRVPDDMKKTLHDFLVKSQRELDRELSRRPKTQDGVMYVGDESPLALTEGLDSTPFFLAIVGGKLVLKDADGNVVFSGLGDSDLAANGGTVPETDRVNSFALMQQVAGQDLTKADSNANGSWVEFAGIFAVCWRVVTPDWTTGSFQDWAMPITFSSTPAMFVTMADHIGGGAGNSAITVLHGCITSASAGNGTFRIAFRDGTDATAGGQVLITAMGLL